MSGHLPPFALQYSETFKTIQGKGIRHMESMIDDIRRQLTEHADETIRLSGQRFFKENEKVLTYGVKTAVVSRLAKTQRARLKDQPKETVFALCEQLWQSGYMEESFIACDWAYSLREQYQPDDFQVFAHWVADYVGNWASCDTLCNHTLGALIERYPQYLAELKRWTACDNRWQKRAAAVTLIIPARKGLFLADILDIAERLLLDPDDMVQKGYGWMLKAASEAHPQAVFDYLMDRKTIMPRTAFRYALEKMPAEWRAKAMTKEIK